MHWSDTTLLIGVGLLCFSHKSTCCSVSAQPIGHNGETESECSLLLFNGSVAFSYGKRCENVIPPWHFFCCVHLLWWSGITVDREYCLMSTLRNVQGSQLSCVRIIWWLPVQLHQVLGLKKPDYQIVKWTTIPCRRQMVRTRSSGGTLLSRWMFVGGLKLHNILLVLFGTKYCFSFCINFVITPDVTEMFVCKHWQ